MPSTKVLVQSLVTLAAVAAIVVAQLADQGIELPGWIAIAVGILGPIAGYLKSETNPSPSAVEAVRNAH